MAQKTHAARLPDPMGIRDELREYPDDLAAETVAAKIGLPPGRLFQYDTRRRRPGLRTRSAICLC